MATWQAEMERIAWSLFAIDGDMACVFMCDMVQQTDALQAKNALTEMPKIDEDWACGYGFIGFPKKKRNKRTPESQQ